MQEKYKGKEESRLLGVMMGVSVARSSWSPYSCL